MKLIAAVTVEKLIVAPVWVAVVAFVVMAVFLPVVVRMVRAMDAIVDISVLTAEMVFQKYFVIQFFSFAGFHFGVA